MKTIPLAQALALLSSCAAVTVDGGYVTFPSLRDDGDDPGPWEGVCLLLSPNEGDEQVERFTEEANASVKVEDDGTLILVNTDGEETTVLPLYPHSHFADHVQRTFPERPTDADSPDGLVAYGDACEEWARQYGPAVSGG